MRTMTDEHFTHHSGAIRSEWLEYFRANAYNPKGLDMPPYCDYHLDESDVSYGVHVQPFAPAFDRMVVIVSIMIGYHCNACNDVFTIRKYINRADLDKVSLTEEYMREVKDEYIKDLNYKLSKLK